MLAAQAQAMCEEQAMATTNPRERAATNRQGDV
jgi:hypothetical protein